MSGKNILCLACLLALSVLPAFSQDVTPGPLHQTSDQLLSESISLAETLQSKIAELRMQLTNSVEALTKSEAKYQDLIAQFQGLQDQYRDLVLTSDSLGQDSEALSRQWTTLTDLYQDYLTAFNDYKKSSEAKIKALEDGQALAIVLSIIGGLVAGGVVGALVF